MPGPYYGLVDEWLTAGNRAAVSRQDESPLTPAADFPDFLAYEQPTCHRHG
jgi:hypothetical protein